MSGFQVAGFAVAAVGALIVVVATLAMLPLTTSLDRLHLVAPIGSLGLPLVVVGVLIAQVPVHGFSLSDGELLLIAAVVAVTGPAAGAATARMRAERVKARDEEPD